MFCVTLIIIASLAGVHGLYDSSDTSIWDHPYQAAILHRHWDTQQFRFACSGAIVSQTFVLTTASCTGDSYEKFRVRVGSSYRQSGGQLLRVQDVYRDPDFSADLDSDIALLKLADRLVLSRRVAVVNLPKQDEELIGNHSRKISSWEFDAETVLQCTTRSLRIISECNTRYRKYSAGRNLVTDNMICIAYAPKYNYKSPCCERDQGALLVGAGTLHGLSSWSYGCGSTDYPSVFTRVSAFITRIEIILQL